ncbi:hypothetical protein [Saccharothrix obliqua]|uniref:hypothetical protein n=1 Tax=Saccharothrix obliqua TaxID=2861747 RepID=UPI001C5DF43A|nr:hypothetical protein [Saccharothrix obliqua]MBW4722429.1 hypothetical protein [Saccharothrix obliqua]
MEEALPPERSVAAKIITAELLKLLEPYPAFRGRLQPWMYKIREWPGKVVPESPEQVQAAVLTLISRTLWPHSELRTLIAVLTPLYQHGWCNDAIVRAMDLNPDGSKALPWHAGTGDGKHRGELESFIDKRLRVWRRADPDSLASNKRHVPPSPVLSGKPFHEWAGAMHRVYGDGQRDTPTNPMTPEQITAAYDRNHRRYGTPVARARAREARINEVSNQLSGLGGTIADDPTRDEHQYLDSFDSLRLLADPAVHRALCEFAAAEPRSHHHLTALRGAVRNARLYRTARGRLSVGAAAELAAAVTRADGTPVPQQTLRYLLDNAR